MKIVVLVKETPDTETKIKLTADNKGLDTAGYKFIINPYDEYAIEEALKLKAASGSGEVVLISFGAPSSKERVIKGLAMGADRALLVDSTGCEGIDSLGISKVLAAAIKEESPSVVFTGKQGIDDDNMHVMAMVGEILDWPHVNVVNKMEVSGETINVERSVEGGQVEKYQVSMPAIIGCDKALNTPRYASLPGIMKAKKKPFDIKKPGDLGVEAKDLSGKISIKSFQYPPEKSPGQVFEGESVEAMVGKVVDLLKDEAKVL